MNRSIDLSPSQSRRRTISTSESLPLDHTYLDDQHEFPGSPTCASPPSSPHIKISTDEPKFVNLDQLSNTSFTSVPPTQKKSSARNENSTASMKSRKDETDSLFKPKHFRKISVPVIGTTKETRQRKVIMFYL